jgi:hypothetical protein
MKNKLVLEKVSYDQLNSRQKENYNYHKASYILSKYGFATIRLSDDWMGADFIAIHITGDPHLKIQLKGRLTVDKKYLGKDLYICFLEQEDCYLYPHDEMVTMLETDIENSKSWKDVGSYSWPGLSEKNKKLLRQYQVTL